MPAAPREGERINFDETDEDAGTEYGVKYVVWYPGSGVDFDVYVVLGK